MLELTRSQVTSRRLTRSQLVEPAAATDLVEVVRRAPLIQAQLLSAAELGLSARIHGLGPAGFRTALYETRSIVKTWSLRGTLHLVATDEVGMWAAAATGGERYWESPPWLDRYDLTLKRSRALLDAIGEALRGQCLTRAELVVAIEESLGWTHPTFHSGFGELLHPRR